MYIWSESGRQNREKKISKKTNMTSQKQSVIWKDTCRVNKGEERKQRGESAKSHENARRSRGKCMGIKREMRVWVVLPHVFGIEETPKPRDLRREVNDNDLHLDIELQP